MHDYDSGMVGDMAGILLPAPANAPSPFTFYLTEDEILQAGILQAENSQAGNAQSEEPDATMEAVLRLFSLDENNPHAGDEDDEENGELDLVDQQLRTQRLRSITLSLDQLWWSGPRYMAAAAEKLADGSRDPRWRIPMGNAGLLDAFLMIVASEGIQSPLMIHVLRLIGNTCADTDENRARVVSKGSLRPIIALLKDRSLVTFVIPVLFNICFDYEPAQKQASDLRLSTALVQFISNPGFEENRPFLGYACKLLDMVVTKPNESSLAPDDTVDVLLNLAASRTSPPDLDDFISLVSTSTKYLQHNRFQVSLCKSMGLDTALRILLISYTRLENSTMHMDDVPSPDEDEAKQLSVMRSDMNQVLSDISALPEFAARCPVNSPMSSYLRKWLSSPQSQLQVCACIMLGNLARSDTVCSEFVHTSRIHRPLMDILTSATSSQILFAAIGFLKNLALPPANKIELGNAGLIEILPRLWAMDTLPQIQYSAISLARQLLIANYPNVMRINAPLSSDPDSPAHSKSRLSVLISLFTRTDAEPVRMEIARTLAAVCRVLASRSSSVPDLQARRAEFFEKHRDIGTPLSFMVIQSKWPVVRSEGWFVLALLARTEEGVQCVADIMHDIDVFTPLMELMTGKSFVERMSGSALSSPMEQTTSLLSEITAANSGALSPAAGAEGGGGKEAEMLRIDRENALVLVSELLRQRGPTMAFMRRTAFEDLLQGGAGLHLSYREGRRMEDVSPPPPVSSESAFMLDDMVRDSHTEMFD